MSGIIPFFLRKMDSKLYLDPQGDATRAQAAAILMRFAQLAQSCVKNRSTARNNCAPFLCAVAKRCD